MNKATRILLAIGLILAVAAPAFAEFKLNGYYRLIGYGEEKKAPNANTGTKEDGDSQQFIDQRLRMRANWTLNDNVGLVYFAEVDTTWGENNKAAVGQGGQSYLWTGGADGVNVETKQAFLDLKFGDTAVQARYHPRGRCLRVDRGQRRHGRRAGHPQDGQHLLQGGLLQVGRG